MKQEFISAHFRNFFSFGNVRQDIVFKNGVNLILGLNESTGRSNFTGKSSLIEVLPVALFGKSSKGVKKDQLVNWTNRKNCEVGVTIKIDSDEFTIFRAIKPDTLEIYKNGVIIPPSADVRDYQKMLENDILRMDYNMFMSLIYTNLNKYEPILQMSKPNKRRFLERVFSLENISKLNDLSITKMKKLNNNTFRINTELDSIDKLESELTKQTESLKNNYERLDDSKNRLNELCNERDNLPDYDDIERKLTDAKNTLESIKERINKNNKLQTQYDANIKIKKNEINMLKKNIDNSSRISGYIDDVIIAKKEYDELVKEYPDIDVCISNIRKEIKKLISDDNDKTAKLTSIRELRTTANTNLSNKTKDINALKNDSACPLCGSNLDDNDVLETLEGKRTIHVNDVMKYDVYIKELITNIADLKKSKGLYDIELNGLVGIKQSIIDLSNKIKNIDDLKKQQIESKKSTKQLSSVSDELREIEHHGGYSKIIGDDSKHETSILNEIHDLEKVYRSFSQIKTDITSLTRLVEQEEKTRSNIQSMIHDNCTKLKEYRVTKASKNVTVRKMGVMVDYLEYVKHICKDENVKQFAISNNIPYLTKKTNEYLAKCGMNYYIKLDNWLDVEIVGPGISNCSYKSLSGAESKSLDLAIQFSFLDASRLQAGVFPDILLLDELLDSSVDGMGLETILHMIKTRQLEDDSKIFLITHRQEIDEIEVDSTCVVEKRGDFSYITEV